MHLNTHDLYRLAEPNIARDRKYRVSVRPANAAAQRRRLVADRRPTGTASNVDHVAVLGTE